MSVRESYSRALEQGTLLLSLLGAEGVAAEIRGWGPGRCWMVAFTPEGAIWEFRRGNGGGRKRSSTAWKRSSHQSVAFDSRNLADASVEPIVAVTSLPGKNVRKRVEWMRRKKLLRVTACPYVCLFSLKQSPLTRRRGGQGENNFTLKANFITEMLVKTRPSGRRRPF